MLDFFEHYCGGKYLKQHTAKTINDIIQSAAYINQSRHHFKCSLVLSQKKEHGVGLWHYGVPV